MEYTSYIYTVLVWIDCYLTFSKVFSDFLKKMRQASLQSLWKTDVSKSKVGRNVVSNLTGQLSYILSYNDSYGTLHIPRCIIWDNCFVAYSPQKNTKLQKFRKIWAYYIFSFGNQLLWLEILLAKDSVFLFSVAYVPFSKFYWGKQQHVL